MKSCLPVPLISAKFLGDDEQAGRIAVKTGKTKAPKRPEPNAPTGWLTVNQALSWTAVRLAASNLNEALYFGASLWFIASPSDVAEWLDETVRLGRVLIYQCEFSAEDLEALVAEHGYRLRREAAGGSPPPAPMTLREAAQLVLAELQRKMPAATELHDALWRASERLRHGIASGSVRAAGWPASRCPGEDQPELPPLEAIPREVCLTPVTLAHGGILGFTRGDRVADGCPRLWSSVRIDAASLVAADAQNASSPQAMPDGRSPSPSLHYSPNALRAWFHLDRLIRPKVKPYPTEEQDHRAAEAYFGQSIPRDEFREIRRQKIPAHERKTGRPSKR